MTEYIWLIIVTVPVFSLSALILSYTWRIFVMTPKPYKPTQGLAEQQIPATSSPLAFQAAMNAAHRQGRETLGDEYHEQDEKAPDLHQWIDN